MNTDFSKYKKFIESFSGQVSNVNFDTLFNTATQSISKKERFLLKMELKRIANPCSRLIDLRGHVDGECHPYEHEGRTHYLDELAQEVYEKGIARYGQYTVGVYEATTNTENNYRVIYQNEKNASIDEKNSEDSQEESDENQHQYPAIFYRVGDYFNRTEERLNYATSIQVTLADNSDFECKSVDLSVTGCRFRLKTSKTIVLNQTIYIRFKGLAEQYLLNDGGELFVYTIKTVVKQGSSQLIGAKLAQVNDTQIDTFTDFLSRFILENKRRYKINLDNTIHAVKVRAFEQFIVPKTHELPIYLTQVNNQLLPRFTVASDNNNHIINYWQDEKKRSTLDYLLTSQRINFLKQAGNENKKIIVFSFIHEFEKKSYFYTADDRQLADKADLMQHYLAFASSKKSFAVMSLSLCKIQRNHAQSQFTLSQHHQARYAYLNDKLPHTINNIIASLPYVVLVTDLTHEFNVKTYKNYSYADIKARQLKIFGHKRSNQSAKLDTFSVDYNERRQESRFRHETPILLEKTLLKINGVLDTFSLSGLKVNLHQPVKLKKGDIVKISLPSLQKLTKEFNLQKLSYEVVHVNSSKKIISLKIPINSKKHDSRQFFQTFTKKHGDKLLIEEDNAPNPGLANALRNIYSNIIDSPSLIIQTSGSRYKIDTLVGSTESSGLLRLMKSISENHDGFNLLPLLSQPDVMINLTTSLKKMQRNTPSNTQILFIAAKNNIKNVETDIRLKVDTDFPEESQLYDFISRSLEEGIFISIMIKLSRVNEPTIEYLAPELNYVSSYAIHHGKQLERTIWSVAGVAQLIDITDEVLFRFQLSQPMQ